MGEVKCKRGSKGEFCTWKVRGGESKLPPTASLFLDYQKLNLSLLPISCAAKTIRPEPSVTP